MGLFEFVTGNKRILEYEIAIGSDGSVRTSVNRVRRDTADTELVRLWASYHAKIMYNFGYPHGPSANTAIRAIESATAQPLAKSSDCFALAGIAGSFRKSQRVDHPVVTLTGEIYGKSEAKRIPETHFPLNVADAQVIAGSVALLQYAVDELTGTASLKLLGDTARNVVQLYRNGVPAGMEGILYVPSAAYFGALQTGD